MAFVQSRCNASFGYRSPNMVIYNCFLLYIYVGIYYYFCFRCTMVDSWCASLIWNSFKNFCNIYFDSGKSTFAIGMTLFCICRQMLCVQTYNKCLVGTVNKIVNTKFWTNVSNIQLKFIMWCSCSESGK